MGVRLIWDGYGAQYRQDGQTTQKTTFTNEAKDKPSRFNGNDDLIGKVVNEGVFATIADGVINNYGLIEHAAEDAKTYVTANQTLTGDGYSANASFTAEFKHDGTTATPNTSNKMGRINLPYSNKEEDNISVSAALAQGFISVTVDKDNDPSITSTTLNADVVGTKVNYVIVKSGIKTISSVAAQIKYVEINQPNTEIAWSVTTATYEGLMVLSDLNIKLGTTVTVNKATYLGSDMYVGGTFTNNSYSGYYGNTSANEATKYITY